MTRLLYLMLILTVFAVTSAGAESGFVFGEQEFANQGPWISQSQMDKIKFEVRTNFERFVEEGLVEHVPPIEIIKFAWPVRAAAHLTDPGHYGVSGFPDLDPAYPNHLLDFNCGARTYDLDIGYNHAGTDIFNWPFLWNKMDNDEVEVVAAAYGIISYIEDGNDDRSCGFGGGNANVIVVYHFNGAYTIYGHMKNGTLPDKTPGNTVEQGEYLGVVGSSGQSTGPHLHFEVWEDDTTVVDPWFGPCNNTITESWWIDQKPYFDPAINKISTHTAPVDWGTCPDPEITNIANAFEAGEMVYFYAFGRDIRRGDEITFTIFRPDSSVFTTLDDSNQSSDHSPAFYLYWGVPLPGDAPTGTWRFDVDCFGETYTHDFTVGNVAVFFNTVDAVAVGTSVEIMWEVWTDEDLQGFKIYRADGNSPGRAIQINDGILLPPDTRSFNDNVVETGETYTYTVAAVAETGSEVRSRPVGVSVASTGLSLEQNHPNPFNPRTGIEYVLPEAAVVDLSVYDPQGRLVVTLEQGLRAGGLQKVSWDGRDGRGNMVSSGVYFYRLRIDGAAVTRKLVFLK